MMSKYCGAFVLAISLTLTPVVGSAQVTPPRGGQRQRMEMEGRLRMSFYRSIQTNLGFDRTRMESVQGIMQSFQEDRRALNRTQASLRYRLRDPALQDIGEEEATALLREMVVVQQEELGLYQREQEELLTVMSPVELVRFYRLRENLGERMQRVRQGRGQGGGGGEVGMAPGFRGGRSGGQIFR